MCGILLIHSNSHIEREYVKEHLYLLETLEKRGPDKTNVYSNNNVVLPTPGSPITT